MVPGLGAEDRAAPVRRARDPSLDDLRAAAEQQRIRELQGAWGRRRRRTCWPHSASSPSEGPTERLLLSKVLPVAQTAGRATCAATRPATRSSSAGSVRRRTETCHDIDLIATASEPEALAKALRRPSPGGGQGLLRRQRRQDHDPQRGGGRPSDRRARRLRKPPAALHGVGRAQRRAPRASRRDGALGLRARDHRRRHRRGLRGTRPRPRCTSGWAWTTSSPSCARPTGRSPLRRRASCRSWCGRRHPGRPPLPHDDLRRPQHAGGDGGGRPGPRLPLPRGHRPLRQPRLRRTTSRRSAWRSGSGGAGLQRTAPRLPPAGGLGGEHPRPTARWTTPTSCWPSWTGRSPASTPRSGSRGAR